MDSLVVKRTSLPAPVWEWLEASKSKTGVFFFREENDQILLERLDNIDPAMLARVRANVERYHSTLERLADS